MKLRSILVLCALFLWCSACGWRSKDNAQEANLETPAFYFGTMTNLVVDFYYEPGAAPFADDKWAILRENLQSLFKDRSIKPVITLPDSSAGWNALPAQNKTTWSLEAILNLAKTYRKKKTEGTTGNFFVVFLNGYLEENGAAKDSVIGVSITGTTVVAMFKKVIEATGRVKTGLVPRYVEQSTLVHEIGHALGLVNNGVKLSSSHHDSAHGAHCSNPDCVMYWQNEGREALERAYDKYKETGNRVLFGQECIQDTNQFKP